MVKHETRRRKSVSVIWPPRKAVNARRAMLRTGVGIDSFIGNAIFPVSDKIAAFQEPLSEPSGSRWNPPRTRLVPVAVVNPWIVRTVSPSRVLPLRRALRRRLLATRHRRSRHHAAQRCRRLGSRHRSGIRPAHRTALRTERAAMKHRLVHLLRAPAAALAGGVHSSGLNTVAHISA